jgi:serine/threonine protein kinase
VKLHNVFVNGPGLVLMMEFVEGGSLKDYLRENGPLTEDQAKTVFNQLLRVMSYLKFK